MPKDLFQPNAGVFTSIALFQAKTGGQKKTDKVYFYNLVDDGHKMTNKFRKDKNKKWLGIKNELLDDLMKLKKVILLFFFLLKK